MSCSCGCSPCSCQPVNCSVAPCIIQLPDNPAQELTFENINTAGIGFYDSTENSNVQFRGIVSESNALTLTYDSDLHAIIIDFDDALLIADIPTASETERGIAEVATQAETNAGVVDNVIVTPAKLAGRTATETRAGIAEIATQAETDAGVNDATIVTPLKLATFASDQLTTRVFADAVARAAATPNFDGQFGAQNDTEQGYVSGSTAAGDWNGLFTFGAVNTMQAATSINLNSVQLSFSSGEIVVSATAEVIIDGGNLTIDNTGTLDFADGVIAIAGNPLANSVLLGTANTGDLTEHEISNFLSLNFTQSGYTAFSNPATIRTCDTSTVTLPQLAQLVGTLIEDLKVALLPAT